MGSYSNGVFDLKFVFRFDADEAVIARWRKSFEHASRLLYLATDAQFRFGKLQVVNNGGPDDTADAYLYAYDPDDLRSFTTGPLGSGKMLLKGDEQYSPYTIVHEFGHLGFDLADEYEKHSDTYFRLCTTDETTGACIMEFGESSGLRIDPDTGDVIEGVVKYFCDPTNHDPDHNTNQHIRHQCSCWEWIVTKYPGITIPQVSPSAVLPDDLLPDWGVTPYEKHQVVIVNGSPAVNDSSAIKGLKAGLRLWADLISPTEDRFAISVLGVTNPVVLPLSTLEPSWNRAAIHSAIDQISFSDTAATASDLAELYESVAGTKPPPSNPELSLISLGSTALSDTWNADEPQLSGVRINALAAVDRRGAQRLATVAGRARGEFRSVGGEANDEFTGFQIVSAMARLAASVGSDAGTAVVFQPDPANAEHVLEREVLVSPESAQLDVVLNAAERPFDLKLVRPDGKPVSRQDNDVGWLEAPEYTVVSINSPEPGRWQAAVVGQTPQWQLLALVRTRDVMVDLRLKPAQDATSIHVEVVVLAPNPVTGLTPEAEVAVAAGATRGVIAVVPLLPGNPEHAEHTWVYSASIPVPGPNLYRVVVRTRRTPNAAFGVHQADGEDRPIPPVPDFQREVHRELFLSVP